MQAIEATGTIDAQGHLSLDQPLQVTHPGRVKIIVLLTESSSTQIVDQPQLNLTNNKTGQENHQATDTRPIWERVADISAQIPTEEWEKLPKDLSKNLDHYLYGSPKENE